jgi:SagB-type dehydrogenase family enzyme
VREYHEATKLAPGQESSRRVNWGDQPRPFKLYRDLDRVPLPRELRASKVPAIELLDGRVSPGGDAGSIDLSALATLLHHSAGIIRRLRHRGGTMYFRAAACTGALYHVELYLVCGNLPGLDAGVYHFGVNDFSLGRLRAGDVRGPLLDASGAEPHVASAPAIVVATSTFWRNAWRYGDRAYRHSFWDTGTILANLLATAEAHGVPASVVTGFADREVNHLLGVDGIREAAIALVPLGVGDVATSTLPTEAIDPPTVPVSARQVHFPLIEQAHQASSLPDASAVRAWREAGALDAATRAHGDLARTASTRPATVLLDTGRLEDPDHGSHDPIEVVIARRGSARRFDARPILLDALQFMLRAAARPITADTDSSLLDTFLLVERVTGLEPGRYRLTDDQRSLRLLESGTLAEAVERATVSNGIAGAAAANVFFVCDLEEVQRRYGERGYRTAQLHAGIRGGLLYLTAHALGLAATGLTFYDDLVVSLLRSTARAPGVLFMTAVGRPGSVS